MNGCPYADYCARMGGICQCAEEDRPTREEAEDHRWAAEWADDE